jgi:GNAT superfamily N-acetyltransferase
VRGGAIPRDTVIERETEIAYVVTAPAHRRSGVAAALVEDAKARLWNRYGVARACTHPDTVSSLTAQMTWAGAGSRRPDRSNRPREKTIVLSRLALQAHLPPPQPHT